MGEIYTDPTKRHDFVLLFDVVNGNPNGDPDAGNLPRVDPETMHGLVTDVCLKRKVRDYLQLVYNAPIFIQSRSALNTLKKEAAEELDPPLTEEERSGKRPIPRLRSKLCEKYYDIRMFGAVLATGEREDRLNAGQVRGPVQLTFARSIDPIVPLDLSITRKARTTEERMETGETEMGRKPIVPYGLYRAHGFYNPFLAEDTGVSEEDLELFWEALTRMFEFDRSAARGEMTVRGLWIFTHENAKGNAPAHKLFALIKVRKGEGVESPRSFDDYEVLEPTEEQLPSGITLARLV
ncbi:type I-C CRISPR-associated protein Cas7/Csd2 [Candidatus Bipolaricaulota bacterium]|nr:type I-C CRISPR-associated protein Cas7/Csd2 [Candidatus Bipolaricaulota bacterium]